MNLKNCVGVLSISLLFCYCNSKQDNKNTPLVSQQNPFVGEWHFNSTIWYTSQLTLRSNGTFRFHDQSCFSQTFSEGKWMLFMNGIILSSFDNYKPKEDSSIAFFSQPNDTTRIYIKEYRLFLNNDTLVGFEKGLLEGCRFIKVEPLLFSR